VRAVAFRPDGKVVLTGSEDGTAQAWDAVTGKPLGRALEHDGAVGVVALSPDGKTALTASGNKVWLWETGTGIPLGPPVAHSGGVLAGAFVLGGRAVRTLDAQGKVRRWEVPAPLAGTVEALERWAQVLTGMELDDRGGVRVLEARAWQERRRQR
jgi:WD40 repeat protein